MGSWIQAKFLGRGIELLLGNLEGIESLHRTVSFQYE
jgi:hypothetical protein